VLERREIERREEGGRRRGEGRERIDRSPVHLQRRSADRQRPGLTTKEGKKERKYERKKGGNCRDGGPVHLQRCSADRQRPGLITKKHVRKRERKKGSKKGRREVIAETGVQFTSSAVPQIANGRG
jgi:hypothetical protein